jgi:hypothetical protein
MQELANLPEDAIRAFITATQEISGGTQSSKEAKDRKIKAKQVIVQFMQTRNQTYIQVDNMYLNLKKSLRKPPVNAEFISRAYKEFQNTQQQHFVNVSVEQVAVKFGEYVFYLQKKMAEEHYDVKLSKKKPMSAMLFDSFTDMTAAQSTT